MTNAWRVPRVRHTPCGWWPWRRDASVRVCVYRVHRCARPSTPRRMEMDGWMDEWTSRNSRHYTHRPVIPRRRSRARLLFVKPSSFGSYPCSFSCAVGRSHTVPPLLARSSFESRPRPTDPAFRSAKFAGPGAVRDRSRRFDAQRVTRSSSHGRSNASDARRATGDETTRQRRTRGRKREGRSTYARNACDGVGDGVVRVDVVRCDDDDDGRTTRVE